MRGKVDSLTLRRPDDWHLHVRDGAMLKAVIGHTARQCARAIIMPNLVPPVTTVEMALAYRQRILDALPAGSDFQPLMTLYLTDNTRVDELEKAAAHPHIHAVKLYPAGATTNSDSGVTDIFKIDHLVAALVETGLPLLVHGEVVDPAVDIFDRERVFIERILSPLLARHPNLKLVMEHITTAEAVKFVSEQGDNIGATITAHHLLYNRNAMLVGGIKPHYYCLPVLKRESDREALLEAATSGNPKFFMGTDSAPHTRNAKESACGCAGAYTAYAALELYAEAFDSVNALDKLEGFTSLHGPAFYGLPPNEDTVTLRREDWTAPTAISLENGESLIPLRAGETLHWRCCVNG